MTEEEIKQRIDQRVAEELRDYFAMKRPGFNIESNCMTQAHGIAEFIIATDENQGIQFYKKGNAKVLANKTIEVVAGAPGKQLDDNKAFAITLDARSGNILISALDGDLILEGGNVKIRATDADGDVSIQSGKTAVIEAPEVDMKGTKVNVDAKQSCNIQGGSCEIYSQTGATMFTSGQDPITATNVVSEIINNIDRPQRRIGIV